MAEPSVASPSVPERAPAPPAIAAPAEHRYAVELTTTAGDYFRIWVVNLALTVLTLGIYSAWAKVRKRRFFYSHTRIDGEGFEYRARPLAILKGRVIAVLLLGTVLLMETFLPAGGLGQLINKALFLVAALFVGPWLMVRSLKFNAANTAYRNVRFRFLGTYRTCFALFIHSWWVIFGLTYPSFKHRLVEYTATNHAYGTTRVEVLDFKSNFIAPYVRVYVITFFLAIAQGFAAAALGPSPGPVIAVTISFYLIVLLLFAYLRAETTNALWNAVRVGPVRFESTQRGLVYAWLYFSNALAILFTLGFAAPWAAIRTLRYRARHLAVIAAGPLDGFVPSESEQVSAAGEEVADLFDFDVGL
jgi:uncharacterized membrane protein YjgN (DUF898 family)